jgi:hypothetical protein
MDDTTIPDTADQLRAPNAGPQPPAPAAVKQFVLRNQRIQDYLVQSLAKGSPLEANLGAVNCDLFSMASHLWQAIAEALQQGPAALEELEYLMPAVEQYLKITKQIDRYAQLAIKLGDATASQPG